MVPNKCPILADRGQKESYLVFSTSVVGDLIIEGLPPAQVDSRDTEWPKNDSCPQHSLNTYLPQRSSVIAVSYFYTCVLFCSLLYDIWWEPIPGALETLHLYVLHLSDVFTLEKKEQCSSMHRTYANQLHSSGTNEDNVFIVQTLELFITK